MKKKGARSYCAEDWQIYKGGGICPLLEIKKQKQSGRSRVFHQRKQAGRNVLAAWTLTIPDLFNIQV